MQKQKKTTLTESQIKLKKYLKPIVEVIINEEQETSQLLTNEQLVVIRQIFTMSKLMLDKKQNNDHEELLWYKQRITLLLKQL